MSKYVFYEFQRFFSIHWGSPPYPGILMNIEGSIKRKLRKPIFVKAARKELAVRKTFLQNAMQFRTASLDYFPKPLNAIWVPDILNDINPTIMEYFEIFPSHSIPMREGKSSSFSKAMINNIQSIFQHLSIRLRLWFSKELVLCSDDAKKLFQSLLLFISTSRSDQLDTICLLSLVPHLKNLYFSNGTITHWSICKHVFEPHLCSLRIIKVSKDVQFIQIIFQFTTNQALIKYNANGRVLIGDNVNMPTVKDFIVFERMLKFPYSSWKIVDRIGGFDKSLFSFMSTMQSDYTISSDVFLSKKHLKS